MKRSATTIHNAIIRKNIQVQLKDLEEKKNDSMEQSTNVSNIN